MNECLICHEDTNADIKSIVCDCNYPICDLCSKNEDYIKNFSKKCLFNCKRTIKHNDNYYTEMPVFTVNYVDDGLIGENSFVVKSILYMSKLFLAQMNEYGGISLIFYILFSICATLCVIFPMLILTILIRRNAMSIMLYNVIVKPIIFFGSFITLLVILKK